MSTGLCSDIPLGGTVRIQILEFNALKISDFASIEVALETADDFDWCKEKSNRITPAGHAGDHFFIPKALTSVTSPPPLPSRDRDRRYRPPHSRGDNCFCVEAVEGFWATTFVCMLRRSCM